ncbi:MAG: bifunctional diaminohydroxyphosphoribosylaminopyrimidine deaminase/5-amino-6-(5-phosphoribosylamino)uracil reductase RibD [Nitrospinota bacterium]
MNNPFMLRALELARKGRTSPNPMVGAVVVKNNRVIAEGFHPYAGGPHAEVVALRKAGNKAKGADLYVNLEPCCHTGRTPPCTDTIIRSGVSRVFAGMKDPNKLVSGKGVRLLRSAGIKVSVGMMKKDCEKLNEVFVKVIETGMPFVTVKTAMSFDGKIATRKGDSQWISGEKSRKFVHELRNRNDAILVGTKTILQDDPKLTCRLGGKRGSHPVRIVLDRKNRIPLKAKVFANSRVQKVIYVSGPGLSEKREKSLTAKNIETLKGKTGRAGFNLKHLMKMLAKRNLTSILVEGGSELNSSLFSEGIVDRVFAFVCPMLIGGKEAPGPIGGTGIDKISKALRLKILNTTQLGDDLMVEAKPCSVE